MYWTCQGFMWSNSMRNPKIQTIFFFNSLVSSDMQDRLFLQLKKPKINVNVKCCPDTSTCM